MRKPAPVPEQLVTLAEVLGELNGADPRDFTADAERLAQDLTPRVPITRDWAGRPCVSWTDGERVLLSLRRDREQMARERAVEQAAVQAEGFMLPFGCVQLERPGEPTWTSPALVGRRDIGDHGRVEVPG